MIVQLPPAMLIYYERNLKTNGKFLSDCIGHLIERYVLVQHYALTPDEEIIPVEFTDKFQPFSPKSVSIVMKFKPEQKQFLQSILGAHSYPVSKRLLRIIGYVQVVVRSENVDMFSKSFWIDYSPSSPWLSKI